MALAVKTGDEVPGPNEKGWVEPEQGVIVTHENQLHRKLKGRHMQMIAVYV
jgi:amino acid permease